MGEDAMLDRSALPSTVDRLVERFATRCGANANVRQLRELAESLVLDVIGAMRSASIAEIADAVGRLERRQKTRSVSPTPRAAVDREASERRPAGRDGWRPGPGRPSGRDRGQRRPPSAGRLSSSKRDAFDITRPSELLDTVSAATASTRREEQPPSSVRRMREPPIGTEAAAAPASVSETATPSGKPVDADARAPAVPLREGEQVLRSSSAGVVIRRMRSA